MLKLRTLKCNRKVELMLDFYIHKTRFLHLKSSISLNLIVTQCSIFRRRQWHPTPVLLPGKSMDGGAWWAAVHGVAKSRTWLSDFTFTFHEFHALEKEMATHSSILAWRIPGMEEPGGLPSMGSHRVGHDWSDLAAAVVYFKLSSKWKSKILGFHLTQWRVNLLPPSQNSSWSFG